MVVFFLVYSLVLVGVGGVGLPCQKWILAHQGKRAAVRSDPNLRVKNSSVGCAVYYLDPVLWPVNGD